jgi:hypothetical protein
MNPTAPLPPPPILSDPKVGVDTTSLLTRQMQIADLLQQAVIDGKNSLSTRDLKDLATASSTMIGLAQKTEHLLKEVETYRLFSSVVMEFIRQRTDSLGEDLLAELRSVAAELHAQKEVDQVVKAL